MIGAFSIDRYDRMAAAADEAGASQVQLSAEQTLVLVELQTLAQVAHAV